MSKVDKCKADILKSLGGTIDKRVVDGIVEHIDFLANKYQDPKTFRHKANQYFKEFSNRAIKIVKQTEQDAIKLQARLDLIDNPIFKKTGMHKGLEAIITGTNYNVESGNLSIAQLSQSVHLRATSILMNGLENKQLTRLAMSGKHDLEVMKVMHKRRRGEEIRDGEFTPEAITIADTFGKTSNFLQDVMELSGSTRGRRAGYLMMNHDALKIEKVGLKQWVRDMERLLDFDQSFGDQADDPQFIRRSLLETGNRIVRESYDRGVVDIQSKEFMMITAESRYKGMSKSRHFEFKTPEAEFEYRQKYGDEILLEGLMKGIRRDSRASGALQVLGQNPKRAFEALKSHAAKSLVGDREASKKFKSELSYIDHLYSDTVNGFKMNDNFLAKAATVSRAVSSMSLLGGSAIVAMPTDAMSAALNLQTFGGGNLVNNFNKIMANYSKGITNPKDIRRLRKMMGIVYSNNLGEFHSRFNPEEMVLGGISKLQDIYFKFSGLTPHTDNMRFSAAQGYSMVAGEFSNRTWGELPPSVISSFNRYGIGPDDWATMRSSVEDFDGIPMITPYGLEKAGNMELSLKYTTLLNENAFHRATPTPDNQTRTMMLFGSEPGSVTGELIRFMGHLKSFPLAIWKANQYALLNQPQFANMTMSEAMKTPRGLMTIGKIIGSLTLAGAMATFLRNTVNNRETQMDSEFLKRSLLVGGAAGLYGDFLLAEYHKHYRSLSQDILGPVIGGTAHNMAGIISSLATDKGREKAGIRLFNEIVRNAPGSNLFYTKAILDSMILDHIREAIDPEYMMRKRKREAAKDKLIEF